MSTQQRTLEQRREYERVRIGQLPAGPMKDRRTKRERSRSDQRRNAIARSLES